MPEPQTLAEITAAFPPDSRMAAIAREITAAATDCAQRKARVLAHPDLAAKLTAPPLGYARPEQWNGWVPPRLLSPDDPGESLLAVHLERGGGLRFRHNQLGRRAAGEQVNDSPRREALIAIGAEAWKREQQP